VRLPERAADLAGGAVVPQAVGLRAAAPEDLARHQDAHRPVAAAQRVAEVEVVVARLAVLQGPGYRLAALAPAEVGEAGAEVAEVLRVQPVAARARWAAAIGVFAERRVEDDAAVADGCIVRAHADAPGRVLASAVRDPGGRAAAAERQVASLGGRTQAGVLLDHHAPRAAAAGCAVAAAARDRLAGDAGCVAVVLDPVLALGLGPDRGGHREPAAAEALS
jgi:hypothetical protein